MIAEDFISKLVSKFKDKKDDERNAVFKDDLIIFVNACPEMHLLDVYRWVSLDHKYSTPFLLSKIYDYAKKMNYINTKRVESKNYWLKCKCGGTYSKEGRGCPKCRSHVSFMRTGEAAPQDMVLVHEDCFYCTIYPESVKRINEKKCYGATCSQHGTIENVDKCGKCECKECCRQMFMYNRDPKGTIEKYKTTELGQPWLMGFEPLDETLKHMLKKMRERKGAKNER